MHLRMKMNVVGSVQIFLILAYSVSQSQTRRQELSTKVNCLTSADYFLDLDESFTSTGTTKRKPPSTWWVI